MLGAEVDDNHIGLGGTDEFRSRFEGWRLQRGESARGESLRKGEARSGVFVQEDNCEFGKAQQLSLAMNANKSVFSLPFPQTVDIAIIGYFLRNYLPGPPATQKAQL